MIAAIHDLIRVLPLICIFMVGVYGCEWIVNTFEAQLLSIAGLVLMFVVTLWGMFEYLHRIVGL